jgi:hypothetical protein
MLLCLFETPVSVKRLRAAAVSDRSAVRTPRRMRHPETWANSSETPVICRRRNRACRREKGLAIGDSRIIVDHDLRFRENREILKARQRAFTIT